MIHLSADCGSWNGQGFTGEDSAFGISQHGINMSPLDKSTNSFAEILAAVQESSAIVYDRDQLARLLRIRRRASLALMRDPGGTYEPKQGWRLPADKLLKWLRHKANAAQELAGNAGSSIYDEEKSGQTPCGAPQLPRSPRRLKAYGLPKGVTLEPGIQNRLTLEFETIEELMQKLLALSLKLHSQAEFYRSIVELDRPTESIASTRLEIVKAPRQRPFKASLVS